MSYPIERYTDEKGPVEVETLPVPITYVVQPKKPSIFRRCLKAAAIVLSILFILGLFNHAPSYGSISKGCHGIVDIDDDGHHQHPIGPPHKWHSFNGTTHFEFEPFQASGLTVKGGKTFGKVVFETSKLSEKVVIDLDIRTSKKDKHHDISIKEDNGHLTIDTPSTGKLKTYSAAKVLIPSNIIGTFALTGFDLNLPRHMVDYSSLPESLEIGDLDINIAKGFIKPGHVHTNNTHIKIGAGGLRGSLTQARLETSIDVARGNVTLDIPSITGGSEGVSTIKLGNGHLKGSVLVYKSTSLNVAQGSIYVDAAFKDAPEGDRAELTTNIASGPVRVYVDSIAAERLFKATHNSVAGDQLITYPDNFQGTIDARGITGNVKLEGKDLAVEKVVGGLQGKKGDSERNYISVKCAKGALDVQVGDDE